MVQRRHGTLSPLFFRCGTTGTLAVAKYGLKGEGGKRHEPEASSKARSTSSSVSFSLDHFVAFFSVLHRDEPGSASVPAN